MKIQVSGFLELSKPLAELMEEMEIEPARFFKERLDEAVERLDERIANELQILSPCLTSYLSMKVLDAH
ncbi:MAG: hypothetical protein ACE5NN_06130 [Candidatus Bathyarchaeia archaeon]